MELPVYGLDIETDTTVDGLAPEVAPVVAVALSTAELDVVLDGGERGLLAALDELLGALPCGVLATWNGRRFDLPYLAARAARHGLGMGLVLEPDGRGGQRGRWGPHRHLDVYELYRADVGPALGVSCGLKSIARLVGLGPVEVDVARLHTVPEAEVRRYVASDARCTRALLLRRGPSALGAADRLLEEHHDPSPPLPILAMA